MSTVSTITEAVRWFRRSADQGHPSGQANLGWMYENGRAGGHFRQPGECLGCMTQFAIDMRLPLPATLSGLRGRRARQRGHQG
jgi:TPR repeat protein